MAPPSPHPRSPLEAAARPAAIPSPRPAGQAPLEGRLAARVPRPADYATDHDPQELPPALESASPASLTPLWPAAAPASAPHPAPVPARRPILQPWEAASVDPEDTGKWGVKHRQDPDLNHRRSRRLASLGLAVAVPLGAIVVWQSAIRAPVATPAPAPAPIVAATPPPASADNARLAADTARGFLATTTLDERARFVRHPEITRARLESWHTQEHPLRPLQVLNFHDRWAEERVGNHTFLMFYMEMADFTTRAIALESLPDGGYAVDWESFESWSAIPWTTYLATESPDPLEFRVVAEKDTYYNFAYADSSAWACFRLTDPADQAHVWGYCPVNSEPAYALGHLLRRQRHQATSQVKAILRLRFASGGPGRRQVLIESLVQDSWVKPDP